MGVGLGLRLRSLHFERRERRSVLAKPGLRMPSIAVALARDLELACRQTFRVVC